MGGWTGDPVCGWLGERINDNDASSGPPTDQLKLNWGHLSWSVGAECGKIGIKILQIVSFGW